MATIGQKLREEREKRGWTLRQLANQTRINVQYFEAIEKDDRASLPGGFFYRSFLRQYARLLELPQSVYQPELDKSLADEAAEAASRDTALPARKLGLDPIPTGVHPEPDSAKIWTIRVVGLVVVVALATGVYTAWEKWKNSQIGVNGAQQAVTEVSPPAPNPPSSSPAAAQVEQQPPAAQPAASPSTSVVEQQPPASQPGTPLAPAVTAPVAVTVRATGVVWISVSSRERVLFTGTLRAGDVKSLSSQDTIRLRLGDAGAAGIEWNGKPVPSVGPKGQVRTVEFTSSEYRIIPPPQYP